MGDLENIHTLQEEADKIMAHEGGEKGLSIINVRNAYLKEIGEKGLQKIEEGMAELGYPFSYGEVKPFGWYQAGYLPLSMLVAKHLLGWDKTDIYEFGKITVLQSSVLRTTLSLVSMKVAYNNVSRLWNTHFDFGGVEAIEYNQEEKSVQLRVRGYRFGGIGVQYLRGYLTGFVNRVVGKEASVTYKGACETENQVACDEYFLDW